jgi:hypothetical protein
VSDETKTLVFNVLPLFAIAVAYAGVTAVVLPAIWRERSRATAADITLATVFPSTAIVALLFGAIALKERTPFAGHVWLSFAALLVALLPACLFFGRFAQAGLVSGGDRVREAEQRTTELDRELSAVTDLSSSLLGAETAEGVARPLIDQAVELVGVEFGALLLIDDDLTEAAGVLGRNGGRDEEWFSEVRLDLNNEPSGTASTVFERAPLSVYDAESSALVSARIVGQIGAKSVAFVPLIADGRVLAVLVIASLGARRAFPPSELALVQSLANEAALALARLR